MSVEAKRPADVPLAQFLEQLNRLCDGARTAFADATSAELLEAARVEFLGAKSGQLKAVQKNLASIAGPDKPVAGQRLNEVKTEIQNAFDQAKQRLQQAGAARQRDAKIDPTIPGRSVRVGRLHPITQTIEELKDI